MHRTKFVSVVLLVSTALTGCSLSPSYKKPDVASIAKYKETNDLEGRWKIASQDAGKPDRTAWWNVFNDAELNRLQQLAAKNSNTLQAANARVTQARALGRQATSVFLPSVNILGNAARSDLNNTKPSNNFLVGGAVSYEANTLFQMRDIETNAKANTKAAENLYQQALLIVHGDVAQNYFALLSLDTERDLLQKTIKLREEGENLIERRFKEGEAGEQDFLRAKAETSSTKADLKALDQRRALIEHALAVLVGTTPAEFDIAQTKLPNALPRIPAGLPSVLLERRPDVAAAEQQLIAINSEIGISRAAFFPNISLTALGGLSSSDLGDLFKWSSRAWTLGPLFGTAFSLPLFDNGRRVAAVDLAKARYDEQVANYRQQVLVAFKDVEDNLSALNLQADQAKHLYQAAQAATRASELSNLRYREGETSYLEVLDTQRDALSVQRAYTQAQGARFQSTIGLIRSLGGGWQNASLAPSKELAPAAIEPETPKQALEASDAASSAKDEPAAILPKRTEEMKPAALPEKKAEPVKPLVEAPKPAPASQAAPIQAPITAQKPAPLTPQPEGPTDVLSESERRSILFD